ncbi:tail protein [Staphylococcus phage PG-2021_46]
MKNGIFSDSEKLSTILLIILGLIPASRGVYWITNSQVAINDSPLYEKLDSIAPLFIWGLPVLIGGLFLIMASIFIVSPKTKTHYYIFLIIGGLLCGLGSIVIAAASVENNLNWLTPVHNTCLSIGFFAITWIGISSLWNQKKEKT